MLDKNGYAPSVVDPYSDLSKRCYHCDWRGDLVRHEIFNASNRQKSKAYGLWIYLCPRCHMDLHDRGEGDKELQALAEKKWIEWNYPNDPEKGQEEFIKRYGKSYRAFFIERFTRKQ